MVCNRQFVYVELMAFYKREIFSVTFPSNLKLFLIKLANDKSVEAQLI